MAHSSVSLSGHTEQIWILVSSKCGSRALNRVKNSHVGKGTVSLGVQTTVAWMHLT